MTCSECDGPVKAKGLCKTHYMRAWKAANKERMQAQRRAEYERDRSKVIERSRQRRMKDPERHREHQRAWRRRNAKPRVLKTPEELQARRRNTEQVRRARLRNAPINDFTVEQWFEVLDEHAHRCHYCGTTDAPLQQEHMVPLSRGGSHTKSNIVPACLDCNTRKGTMTAEEFGNVIRSLALKGTDV